MPIYLGRHPVMYVGYIYIYIYIYIGIYIYIWICTVVSGGCWPTCLILHTHFYWAALRRKQNHDKNQLKVTKVEQKLLLAPLWQLTYAILGPSCLKSLV